ncbi:MAG: hypothetical protein N3A66_09520, partial [Planctomycetota bacterium]|nr:hypothetical protein [Planctomycetota bacterium]
CTRYLFRIAARELIDAPGDWAKLRLGLAVRWPGGPGGADRLRERFWHADRRAPHAGLAENPTAWRALDLSEYESLIADRKARILIAFEQPMEGKATVVIEDAAGRRIRNLLSGAPRAKGRHLLIWDGLDDEGELVKAGQYSWRSLHHPGLRPEYLFSFCNGDEAFTEPFGSNHQHFVAVATNGQQVFFAAAMTEGGYAMIGLDLQGRFQRGYNPLHGAGMGAVAIAADGQYLYAAHDGEAWGQHIKKDQPNWKDIVRVTLSRFEIASGRPADYPGGKRFAVIEEHEWGPGASQPELRHGLSLGGLALWQGKIYLASRKEGALLVIDPAEAKILGRISLPSPGALAAAPGGLFAVSAGAVVRVDPIAAKVNAFLPAGDIEPCGLAAEGDSNLYVSDGRSHTIKVFDARGKMLRAIGKPGGDYVGPYEAERMVRPRGLAIAGGRLWVAEDRRNPKRALAWDLKSGKVVLEKFGNPPYGSPNAGIDDQDPQHW